MDLLFTGDWIALHEHDRSDDLKQDAIIPESADDIDFLTMVKNNDPDSSFDTTSKSDCWDTGFQCELCTQAHWRYTDTPLEITNASVQRTQRLAAESLCHEARNDTWSTIVHLDEVNDAGPISGTKMPLAQHPTNGLKRRTTRRQRIFLDEPPMEEEDTNLPSAKRRCLREVDDQVLRNSPIAINEDCKHSEDALTRVHYSANPKCTRNCPALFMFKSGATYNHLHCFCNEIDVDYEDWILYPSQNIN